MSPITGANPTLLKKGIDKAVETVGGERKKFSREVSGEPIAETRGSPICCAASGSSRENSPVLIRLFKMKES